jgi:hypothetical protein
LSGSLPSGLSFSNGTISGTPLAAGSFGPIHISVTDAAFRTASTANFTIDATAGITLSGDGSGSAQVGDSYTASFSAAGGVTPLHLQRNG